jgi:hypothetical protein
MLLIAGGLLGVFTIDLAVTILRRARNNKPVFTGDRSHIYDQLRDRGWPGIRVVAAVAAAQAVLVSGFVGLAVADPGPGVAVAALLGIALAALAAAWRAGFIEIIS